MAGHNKMSAAIKASQRAVDSGPDGADSHLALANTLRDQHRFQEAAESFRRVIELRPNDLSALAPCFTRQGICRRPHKRMSVR